MAKNTEAPFFIVGCSWSGIKVIKKVLLRHPNLYSFESTNFYRWTEPFGSKAFERGYLNAPSLKLNWQRDGLEPEQIKDMFASAEVRHQLSKQYARRYARRNSVLAKRWFDATPQNVYGLLLLKAQFPKSKILHVVANPIDTVASLIYNPSTTKMTLVAAVNQWLETMQIIQIYKRTKRNDLIEIKYEDFLSEPEQTIRTLLTDLKEDSDAFDFSRLRKTNKVREIPQDVLLDRRKRSGYASLLSDDDIAYILKHCKGLMKAYGYEILSLSKTRAKYSEIDASNYQSFMQNLGEQNN